MSGQSRVIGGGFKRKATSTNFKNQSRGDREIFKYNNSRPFKNRSNRLILSDSDDDLNVDHVNATPSPHDTDQSPRSESPTSSIRAHKGEASVTSVKPKSMPPIPKTKTPISLSKAGYWPYENHQKANVISRGLLDTKMPDGVYQMSNLIDYDWEMLFESFLDYFYIENQDEGEFEKLWRARISNQFRQKMHYARNGKKGKKPRPPQKPKYSTTEGHKKRLAYWASEDFKKLSEQAIINRSKNPAGLIQHFGGAKQMRGVEIEMQKANDGIPPMPLESFMKYYTKQISKEVEFSDEENDDIVPTSEITWANDHALKKKEAIEIALVRLSHPEGPSGPVTQLDKEAHLRTFAEVVGVSKRKTVFGLAHKAELIISPTEGRRQRKSTEIGVREELREMQKELDRKMQEKLNIKLQEMEEAERRRDAEYSRSMRVNNELMARLEKALERQKESETQPFVDSPL